MLPLRTRRTRRAVYAALLSLCGIVVFIVAGAQDAAETRVDVDLRASAPLAANSAFAEYIARIDDCSDLVWVAEAGAARHGVSDLARVAGSACEYKFTVAGASRLAPSVIVGFSDGTEQVTTETFAVETSKPHLTFGTVGLTSSGDDQHLNVSVLATDDSDLVSVSLSVLGVKASDLRANAGVLDTVRPLAFARAETRLYPSADTQTEFALSTTMLRQLTAEEIAQDGVVIVEASAEDASGNQTMLSRIAFTGDDVAEEVLGLSVAPSKIILTNLLQTAVLVPTVDYRFRGPTPLTGGGNGVSYASSHPDLVGVTTSGVVYPKQATGEASVFIEVTYPGLDPVAVPVEIDPNKNLVSLRFLGIDDGHLELPSLNTPVSVPEIVGVFDDGSEAPIGKQFSVHYQLPETAAGLLELKDKQLVAYDAIDTTEPIQLTVSLVSNPAVFGTLDVTAVDAPPTLTISAPGQVTAETEVTFQVQPKDDVGIAEFEYFVDGLLVGRAEEPPFEASFVAPNRINEGTVVGAIATDSAGQRSELVERSIKIVDTLIKELPPIQLSLPANLQQYVEGTPMTFEVPKGPHRYVEFYVDDTLIGSALAPRAVTRVDILGGETIEYVWQLDAIAEETSTDVTTRSAYAIAYGVGTISRSLSSVFRVFRNQAPQVALTQPQNGQGVSGGQTIPVTVRVSDDALLAGTELHITLNDQVVASDRIYSIYSGTEDARKLKDEVRSYGVPIDNDLVGTTAVLKVIAVDYHGRVSESERVNLSVQGDDPPSVSVTHPVAG